MMKRIFALALAFLLAAQQAWAVTPTVTAFGSLGGTDGLTFQVAVASGDTLYVGCIWDNSSLTLAVTHNGDSMGTALATEQHSVTSLSAALYRLLNPDVGTFDIVADLSGADSIACVGLAIASVDSSTPETNTATNEAGAGTSHTANVECPTGNLALDILGLSAPVTNLAPTGGQSERADITAETSAWLGASTIPGTGTMAMSWSWTSSAQRAQVVTCIMGAVASSVGPFRRRVQ